MKLQHLYEAISISHYYNDIKNVIQMGIDFNIRKLNEIHGKFNVFGIKSAETLKQFIEGNLFYNLEYNLKKTIKSIVKNETGKYVPVEVEFQDIKGGICHDMLIGLSFSYCEKMVADLFHVIVEMVDEDCDSHDIHKCLVDFSFENERIMVSELSDKENIDNFINTVLHEVVHLIQNVKQDHRSNTEYRSYLNTDKKQFLDSMGRILKGTNDEQDNKLYYASPQEIAAYSHNIAINIIKNNNLDKKNEKISSNEITHYVNAYLDDIFKNKSDPKIKKVYNRYYKLVYLELQRFLEKTHKT